MKKKIYSQLTYGVIGSSSLLSIIALIFVNRADRKDLPLDGLIALNIFMIFVLLIVLWMATKLKRVYLFKDHIVIMPLFSKTETRIDFNQIVEMKNVFPSYIDPVNCRLIYLEGERSRKVFFIKAVKFIDKNNLGVSLGIVKN
ncbi:hypothetical protein DDR33_24785 [Pararcticibacter amylolyticus]|uniref:Uncharacterized protein n=2 Tax=Pararcticibacter amylolyticus TaxID=2173175 RepID=A0A2U2P989_9SPHI|nr:hypothetical protein DDR33_24785 [Pararcticibacter amylolyticus]